MCNAVHHKVIVPQLSLFELGNQIHHPQEPLPLELLQDYHHSWLNLYLIRRNLSQCYCCFSVLYQRKNLSYLCREVLLLSSFVLNEYEGIMRMSMTC